MTIQLPTTDLPESRKVRSIMTEEKIFPTTLDIFAIAIAAMSLSAMLFFVIYITGDIDKFASPEALSAVGDCMCIIISLYAIPGIHAIILSLSIIYQRIGLRYFPNKISNKYEFDYIELLVFTSLYLIGLVILSIFGTFAYLKTASDFQIDPDIIYSYGLQTFPNILATVLSITVALAIVLQLLDSDDENEVKS